MTRMVLAFASVLMLAAHPASRSRARPKPRPRTKAAKSRPARRASSVAGTWRIDRGIPGPGGALSEDELRDYLGKTVIVGRDELTFGDRSCPSPSLATRTVTAEEAFDDPAVASRLGVKGDVRAVDTTCADPIAEIFWLSDDRIAFVRDGEWLIARRR